MNKESMWVPRSLFLIGMFVSLAVFSGVCAILNPLADHALTTSDKILGFIAGIAMLAAPVCLVVACFYPMFQRQPADDWEWREGTRTVFEATLFGGAVLITLLMELMFFTVAVHVTMAVFSGLIALRLTYRHWVVSRDRKRRAALIIDLRPHP